MPSDGPLFDSFWIESSGIQPLLTCRRCGVHHVLGPDDENVPLTLAWVIEIARQHEWCSLEPEPSQGSDDGIW